MLLGRSFLGKQPGRGRLSGFLTGKLIDWGSESMKQKKGRDYKSTRQGTDEDRLEKNRFGKNIKAAKTRGELDDDKLVLPQSNNENKGG